MGLVQTGKNEPSEPPISLVSALLANSCPGQEERTMRETEVQIGNSAYSSVMSSERKTEILLNARSPDQYE